jgi:hypothetical protein
MRAHAPVQVCIIINVQSNQSDRYYQHVGGSDGAGDVLRNLLFNLPGVSSGEMSREIDGIERIRAGPQQGGKNPEDMSPQELHAVLWQVLSFRDNGMRHFFY